MLNINAVVHQGHGVLPGEVVVTADEDLFTKVHGLWFIQIVADENGKRYNVGVPVMEGGTTSVSLGWLEQGHRLTARAFTRPKFGYDIKSGDGGRDLPIWDGKYYATS